MTSAAVVLDRKLFTGTVAAGGTFTANVTIPTDKALFLRAHAFMTALSSGNLIAVGGLVAEYVVYKDNTTVVVPAALSTSNNPQNSANLIAVWAEGEDPVFETVPSTTSTAVWTNDGIAAAVLTVTNNGVQNADVIVTVDIINFSSV